MKKIALTTISAAIFCLSINSSAAYSFGFTCCDEEDSHCIYEDEFIRKDAYYKAEGKCKDDGASIRWL